jgi:hypothetical protein
VKKFSPQRPGAAEPQRNLGVSPAKHVLSPSTLLRINFVEGRKGRKGKLIVISNEERNLS